MVFHRNKSPLIILDSTRLVLFEEEPERKAREEVGEDEVDPEQARLVLMCDSI